MQDFNFEDNLKTAEKTYNLGKGEYMKLKEGDNRMRLVSTPLPHESEYMGKKNFKWLCQVIDRKDGVVKPYFMQHSVFSAIKDLQLDPDYRFKSIPMPYDITVVAKNAGDITAKYSVRPARENTALTPEELELIKQAPTVQELQARVLEAASEATGDTQSHDNTQSDTMSAEPINVEDIPF